MDFSVTHLMPEAITWLEKRNIKYHILPYGSDKNISIDTFYSVSFSSFLMNKQKQARQKFKNRRQYQYTIEMTCRNANRIDYKLLLQTFDNSDWFMSLPSITDGTVHFKFRKQEDYQLAKLILA